MELGNIMFGTNHNENLIYKLETNVNLMNEFEELLEKLGLNSYCTIDEENRKEEYIIDENKRIYGIKDVIEIHPYQWLDEDQIDTIPNLRIPKYKIVITWYKYPFRDAYANREISLSEWEQIMNEILLYVKGDDDK